MAHIAITGGLGFIGTNLVPELMAQLNAEVRILDNLTNPSGDLGAMDGISVVEGDIRDPVMVDRVVKGADAVVHLAAHTRVMDSIEDPALNFEINTIGTFNVLEAMRKNGVGRFVNASTGGAILGEVPPPIHEEIAAKPASPYGASKLAAEGYCWAYAQSYGISAASLRFSNIYGPHSRRKGSVVAAFLKSLDDPKGAVVFGDGSQTRDYLYVSDLVQGIINAIKLGATGVYQLGAGKPTTLNELIDIIRAVTGCEFPVRYEDFRVGEIVHTYCDIRKAASDLNYAPCVNLPEGVARTWAWFQGQQ